MWRWTTIYSPLLRPRRGETSASKGKTYFNPQPSCLSTVSASPGTILRWPQGGWWCSESTTGKEQMAEWMPCMPELGELAVGEHMSSAPNTHVIVFTCFFSQPVASLCYIHMGCDDFIAYVVTTWILHICPLRYVIVVCSCLVFLILFRLIYHTSSGIRFSNHCWGSGSVVGAGNQSKSRCLVWTSSFSMNRDAMFLNKSIWCSVG